ncbi:MAG TPA: hypothetical protein VLA29_04070 [Acidimicrobiia bacterium]|nr:hypothetical protein [Acidimicrobiia bacterium]
MATRTHNRWPTWIVVVAVLLLIPVLVWALSTVINILVAVSIGFVIAVVAIVALFIWLKNRVD